MKVTKTSKDDYSWIWTRYNLTPKASSRDKDCSSLYKLYFSHTYSSILTSTAFGWSFYVYPSWKIVHFSVFVYLQDAGSLHSKPSIVLFSCTQELSSSCFLAPQIHVPHPKLLPMNLDCIQVGTAWGLPSQRSAKSHFSCAISAQATTWEHQPLVISKYEEYLIMSRLYFRMI